MSTKYRRQSSEGYPTKVDWSAEEHVIKNKKATETHELDRFRPSVDVIPYSYGLLDCIDYRMILREFGGGVPARLI